MSLSQPDSRLSSAATPVIRMAGEADLAPFFAYLDEHLRDNGRGDTPLFQPMPRTQL